MFVRNRTMRFCAARSWHLSDECVIPPIRSSGYLPATPNRFLRVSKPIGDLYLFALKDEQRDPAEHNCEKRKGDRLQRMYGVCSWQDRSQF